MARASRIEIPIALDARGVVRTARIIAKHLTALADELEAPDMIVTVPGEMTAEQAAEIRKRFQDTMGGSQ